MPGEWDSRPTPHTREGQVLLAAGPYGRVNLSVSSDHRDQESFPA